jgi:predicted nucleotidyltransferase
MQKSHAIAELRREAEAVKGFGATGLYLFGSTVRDSASDTSDLDVFVDYDRSGRFSLVELAGIKQLLERRLGVGVDVTTRDSLDPLLRNRIEASAERIF